MKDNELIRLFLPIITEGLAEGGYTGVITKQSNQPTQQGVNYTATVYFTKMGDHRYGYLKSQDVWNEELQVMGHTEVQQYETTFQISSTVISNPKNPYSYTASDLVNEVAAILQSDATVSRLQLEGVGILRIQNVQNLWFMDDRDQYEASPSFEFVLTHKQIREKLDPILESVELDIHRI